MPRYNLMSSSPSVKRSSPSGSRWLTYRSRPLFAIALIVNLLSAIWWTYVGTDRILGHRFTQLGSDLRRAALARDAYSYLHLFMVAGLVLVASA